MLQYYIDRMMETTTTHCFFLELHKAIRELSDAQTHLKRMNAKLGKHANTSIVKKTS